MRSGRRRRFPIFMSCTLRSPGRLARLRPTRYHLSLPMESLKSRFTLAVAAIVLSMSACSSNESVAPEPPEAAADPAFFLSSFQVADPRAEGQLVEGFFAVEQGSWRWTDRVFSVVIRNPSAERDLQLEFQFTIVPQFIDRLGPLTLWATVNGTSLDKSTYDQPGDFVYSVRVSAGKLEGPTARVDFALNKALQPGGGEERTLGVIAVSVALH